MSHSHSVRLGAQVLKIKIYGRLYKKTSTTLYTRVEQVYNSVGKADPRSDFLARFTNYVQCTTKVFKNLGHINVLTPGMNRQNFDIQ